MVLPRGQAPLTLEGLTPGNHTVVLANELSSVTHEVSVEAGATASLVVPMSSTPQGAPVSGWIAVSAPAEVQVYEDTRLLGTSRSDRIMVSAGRHELQIVNEALDFRTYPHRDRLARTGLAAETRLAQGFDGAQRPAVG